LLDRPERGATAELGGSGASLRTRAPQDFDPASRFITRDDEGERAASVRTASRKRPEQSGPRARTAMTANVAPRLAVALVVAMLASHATAATPQARPSLYVFLNTDVKSAVLEKALQARLPDLSVTVFGRFRDFEEALANKSPDAVLALQPLLAARKLDPVLRGVSNGRDVDNYVLVSGGAALEGSLANRTIGAVDFLGRKGTQEFVAALLQSPDVRVKLVARVEDLLSLLQFSAADAVLVPSDSVKSFSERSRLPLHVRALPGATVGRVRLAVLTPSMTDLVARQVKTLDLATNQMLGIDGWRSR
jgi:hypothetical protein